MADFVHLHLHSQYSLLDGANRLDEVIGAAAAAGMPAMALTDHGNMFGAIQFYNQARKAGVKPILGIEAYVAQGSRLDRTPGKGGSNHLVLLAASEAGYRNLIKLTSKAYLEGFYYKPRVDKELLRQHSEGIIALSACLKGEINERIVARQEKEAEATAREYGEIFGEGNFFLEMQDHGIPEQRLANEVLRRIARRTGQPLVVTNDCHYLRKDDAFAHDVLLCIGTQRNLSDTDRLRYASEHFYLKSAEEMHRLFPDDHAALENTVAIAERCNVVIPTGTFHLPEFPVPAGYTLQSYFAEVARAGLDQRLAEIRRRRAQGTAVKAADEQYAQRLEYEIKVIEAMGFAGYFLVVWDFIRYAREQGIPVGPGRGSAAGSVVSYALRITDIDPLQYDLLFERFLNPERISMPDIDIDFCMRRRGEVIHYVGEKYGRDRVAQIITFGTLAAKALIRDVGRVMGIPYAKVDRIAKLVPDMTKSLAEAAREVDALAAEVANDPEVKKIVEVGSRLEGLTRHASVHAAGVVITPRRLDELVPLYKVTKGDDEQIMTQWDMNVVESLGLLKMDFLGLRTLTVIDDAVKILRHQGVELDLDEVPLDDAEVYRLFCEGRTSGIFQFESRGMTDLLRRARPSKFEDLAAFNALYRPGALSVGMVEEYIQRKLGKKKVKYLLPEIKDILEETYGVITYQEQVMLIAVAVAGFTMAEADVLRKAMGKKKAEVMAQQEQKFIDGAVARQVPRAKAQELWDQIEPFAGYGFNKSHSVAYAMLAYKTAYLKAHYPVAFMAAMLNSELSSSDAIAKYLVECRANMGIQVLPPDINESDYFFTVAPVTPEARKAIRFGLGAIKGVGEGAIESVLAARRRVGSFRSLAHLVSEIDLRLANHKVLECLIKAGAFDSLGVHRAALAGVLDDVLEYGQRRRREREEGQTNLFGLAVLVGNGQGAVGGVGGAGGPGATSTAAGGFEREPWPDPAAPVWSERERLRYEKEALGLYLTGNPLSEFQEALSRLTTHSTAGLKEGAEGTVTVGGVVSGFTRVKIKSGPNAGRFMGRFVLEDLEGSLPVTLFANQLQQFGGVVADEAVVLVKGQLRDRGGRASQAGQGGQSGQSPASGGAGGAGGQGGGDVELTVEEIIPLDRWRERPPAGIDLVVAPNMPAPDLRRLRDLLYEHPGPVPVSLSLRDAERTVRITTGDKCKVDFGPELAAAIEAILGPGCVRKRPEQAA
ncbi:MAG TPA: DNA polymerase III subunit alpha [Thermoanaerobaculia bacterium]|nr:DNA polymerase III subunit alpha [Thermoanaerobaculia bacterium]